MFFHKTRSLRDTAGLISPRYSLTSFVYVEIPALTEPDLFLDSTTCVNTGGTTGRSPRELRTVAFQTVNLSDRLACLRDRTRHHSLNEAIKSLQHITILALGIRVVPGEGLAADTAFAAFQLLVFEDVDYAAGTVSFELDDVG